MESLRAVASASWKTCRRDLAVRVQYRVFVSPCHTEMRTHAGAGAGVGVRANFRIVGVEIGPRGQLPRAVASRMSALGRPRGAHPWLPLTIHLLSPWRVYYHPLAWGLSCR